MTHTDTHPVADLITRLLTFGSFSMDDDGRLADFEPNPLTKAAADTIKALIDQVTALQNAGDNLAAHIHCDSTCFGAEGTSCTCWPGHWRIVWQHVRQHSTVMPDA